jgi:hypothetical protein
VKGLASQQHLAAHLAIGDPPTRLPVPELHQPSALDARPEHNDGEGDTRMTFLDGRPRRLADADELACLGRRRPRWVGQALGVMLVLHVTAKRTVPFRFDSRSEDAVVSGVPKMLRHDPAFGAGAGRRLAPAFHPMYRAKISITIGCDLHAGNGSDEYGSNGLRNDG